MSPNHVRRRRSPPLATARRGRSAIHPRIRIGIVTAAACVSLLPLLPAPTAADVRPQIRALLDRDPENGVVVYTLARMEDAAGDPAAVLALLQRLLEMADWDHPLDSAKFPGTAAEPGFAELAARLNARVPSVNRADTLQVLACLDLMPEGSAWDPGGRRLLLSSGHRRTVVAVEAGGACRDLVPEGRDGLLGVLGMEVDLQRGWLWVASAAGRYMRGWCDSLSGRAEVHAFDLATGATRGRWAAPHRPALMNDLTVASDGTVYVTDTRGDMVLRIDPGSTDLVRLDRPGVLVSPNGIALSTDGSAVVVADLLGLVRIDRLSGAAERVAPAPDAGSARHLGGIDGLDRHGDDLIGIQNMVAPGRVWRLSLDAAGRRLLAAELLEAGHPAFRTPTTGAVAGDDFLFVANPFLQTDGRSPLGPPPPGEQHVVLRLPLLP
ncbi:MAG: hypothetical protein R6X25_03375 [Candidatus Krumholzibacteriia bacterium]